MSAGCVGPASSSCLVFIEDPTPDVHLHCLVVILCQVLCVSHSLGLRTTLVRPLRLATTTIASLRVGVSAVSPNTGTCAMQHACTLHFPPLTSVSHCCTFKQQRQGLLSSMSKSPILTHCTISVLLQHEHHVPVRCIHMACRCDLKYAAQLTLARCALCRFGCASSSHCDEICEEHSTDGPHCGVHHPPTQHGHFPGRLCSLQSALCVPMPYLSVHVCVCAKEKKKKGKERKGKTENIKKCSGPERLQVSVLTVLEPHTVDRFEPLLSSSDMTSVMSSVQQVCATI